MTQKQNNSSIFFPLIIILVIFLTSGIAIPILASVKIENQFLEEQLGIKGSIPKKLGRLIEEPIKPPWYNPLDPSQEGQKWFTFQKPLKKYPNKIRSVANLDIRRGIVHMRLYAQDESYGLGVSEFERMLGKIFAKRQVEEMTTKDCGEKFLRLFPSSSCSHSVVMYLSDGKAVHSIKLIKKNVAEITAFYLPTKILTLSMNPRSAFIKDFNKFIKSIELLQTEENTIINKLEGTTIEMEKMAPIGQKRVMGNNKIEIWGGGDIGMIISPAQDNGDISGIVTIVLKVGGLNIKNVAFGIQGQGIENTTEPNIGVDENGDDGWSIVFDTSSYQKDTLYTIYSTVSTDGEKPIRYKISEKIMIRAAPSQ